MNTEQYDDPFADLGDIEDELITKPKNPTAKKYTKDDQERSKRKTAVRKESKKLTNMRAFQEEHPGLIEFLSENQWSDFFRSLLSSYLSYGSLTDKQIAAARRAQAKMAENAKKKEDAKVEVDLAPIKDMFDHARESGLKRTTYRAEGLKLSPASAHSQNFGAIYVVRVEDDAYLGKVMDGKFHPVRACEEEDKLAVLRIAEDPREAAVRWGQKTGRCSCCGRELTDKNSIAAGIGPVCATKWGL